MDNEDTIKISNINISAITLDTMVSIDYVNWDNNDTIDLDSIQFPVAVEWQHEFPAFHRVEEMRKEYPALERAYENFKTIYTLVEQDWIGKQKSDDKK